MAKINKAKLNVVEIIKQAFQKDYIGESNGKHYVWAMDENGKVQIAISLTQPKNFVEFEANHINGGISFEENVITTSVESAPAEITEEERERINLLLKKLGQF